MDYENNEILLLNQSISVTLIWRRVVVVVRALHAYIDPGTPSFLSRHVYLSTYLALENTLDVI